MQNIIYKKITNIRINQVEDVYLVVCFDKDNKNIWNKSFHCFLSSKPCGRNDFDYFFTDNTFADMWRIARENIEKAQETLSKGGMFLLATITKGKMQNHTI